MTDYYSNLPKGCVLNSDEKICNQQYASVPYFDIICCKNYYFNETLTKFIWTIGETDINGVRRINHDIVELWNNDDTYLVDAFIVYQLWKDSVTENLNMDRKLRTYQKATCSIHLQNKLTLI